MSVSRLTNRLILTLILMSCNDIRPSHRCYDHETEENKPLKRLTKRKNIKYNHSEFKFLNKGTTSTAIKTDL